ncbi:hypothetical protein ACFOU2_13325 [Bacillus songklensis]|uniref:Uncharacterized protein n=1 Tax=Bacillus songklensis TaxID=1069116 RepID=A0ABV8B553_9BACI
MKNNSIPPSDNILQLKQKLIYYKSELNHYEQKIKHYEKALQQEKENTAFWRDKHTSMIDYWEKEVDTEELERKINLLTNELTEQKLMNKHLKKKMAHQEPPKPIIQIKERQFAKSDLIAFFMYSVVIPAEKEEDTVIVGNAVIKNQTDKELHSPLLCLKITPPLSANLSGKIAGAGKMNADSLYEQESGAEQWEYAHPNWKEKIRKDGEYWLKPIHTTVLQPNRILSFDSFQIGIHQGDHLPSFLMEGYLYTNEWRDGVPFLNKLVVNFSP